MPNVNGRATIQPNTQVFADAGARTITGRIIEYGVTGHGSITATFGPQALVVPDELKRVKLFRDHRDQYGIGTPVGWMTHIENRPDGAYAVFAIGIGPDGDQALQDALGVRDGLSVEVSDLQMSADRRTVIRAELDAVALVPKPAYSEARVQTVQFHENPNREDTSTMETEDQTQTTTGAVQPITPAAPVVENVDHVDRLQPTTTPGAAPAAEPVQVPASAASFAGTASAPANVLTAVAQRGPSFGEVTDMLQAVMRGEPSRASFALADITSTAFAPIAQPGWLGELWDGLTYERAIIPLLNRKDMTALNFVGYRWTTKPTVDKYAGDKAEIPTSTAAVEPVPLKGQRWAGGWDFDRAFIDFNDHEFVSAFLRFAAEDYAYKTDQDAATWLNTNATAVAGTAPDMLRAVARAGQAIRRGRAGAATFVVTNDADLESLLDFTGLDVPAFLSKLGIAPESWTSSELIPAGTVIAGTKRAVDYYELAGSPIRVNALDLARGGVDNALFGYDAKLLVNPKGLVKVNWAKPAPAEG